MSTLFLIRSSCRHAITKLLRWMRETGSDMAAYFLQVRSREFGECGESRGNKELDKLEECKSDIGNHLSRCHLSREVF